MYDVTLNDKVDIPRIPIEEARKIILDKYDLILSLVSPVLPFIIGEKSSNPLEMYLADIYTVNINLAGVPAISLPCEFSKNNLPIGIQLIGPYFGENKIFKAAYSIEKELKIDTLALK